MLSLNISCEQRVQQLKGGLKEATMATYPVTVQEANGRNTSTSRNHFND